jgi:2,3-bisphosphoglycerate-independent phosphoglycerate mutase
VESGHTVFAQNVHWAAEGAYTGEVSAPMLRELGVAGAIVGHSERRQYFGETDETVVRRTSAALERGLRVVACVGESLEERESGQMELVLRVQGEALADAVGARQRRRAALAAGRRRRSRRRRLARGGIVHRDLPSGREYPLVALVILDGWGCAPPGPGNAVELADTPVFDRLWREFPHTTLKASGEAVGLPEGQMGNSEVGHLTIGSGRVLDQDLQRVNRAIADGSLRENPALKAAFGKGGDVHLLGLVSHGGVHSHIDHLKALLEFAPERTWIHAFTDGRDVSPHAAEHDLAQLPTERIATVAGRYYAMDRDGRWERTQRAYDAIVEGKGEHAQDPVEAVRASHANGITDEFIEPVVLDGRPRLSKDDAAIFFNFRPDRARQLTQKLLENGFDLTTMTRYRDDFDCPVAFEEQNVPETMAQLLAEHGLRQLHVAETEKYAHVTYFFNGGREEEWTGETRILVPSPRDVGTYDKKPEMSADEVADRFDQALEEDGYRFAVVNFANPDMVGHSGVIPAVVKAVETADRCLGEVVETVRRLGGVVLITADHGNAEQMLESDGTSPHTAHTTNPVPLIVTDADARLRDGGELKDLVPTAIHYLGLTKPLQMSGENLCV